MNFQGILWMTKIKVTFLRIISYHNQCFISTYKWWLLLRTYFVNDKNDVAQKFVQVSMHSTNSCYIATGKNTTNITVQ